MRFAEKLRNAMQELDLNQAQMCGLTGKSKASISQYLSGKQIPSEKVQSRIATALGLASDYFAETDEQVFVLPASDVRDKVIPKLDVEKAAELLQMNHVTVRKGLQQGVFPWGYAIHTSEHRWVYFINAKRFAEIEGIAIQ
ncbi:helix-turn-helix domain-containing protein [Blautia stercoris]